MDTTRTHFLPPATSGDGTTGFLLLSTSPSSPWWSFGSIHATKCAEGSKIARIGDDGDSGHAATENYMGFVPLIPRNLPMVLDHNEINQNYTN